MSETDPNVKNGEPAPPPTETNPEHQPESAAQTTQEDDPQRNALVKSFEDSGNTINAVIMKTLFTKDFEKYLYDRLIKMMDDRFVIVKQDVFQVVQTSEKKTLEKVNEIQENITKIQAHIPPKVIEEPAEAEIPTRRGSRASTTVINAVGKIKSAKNVAAAPVKTTSTITPSKRSSVTGATKPPAGTAAKDSPKVPSTSDTQSIASNGPEESNTTSSANIETIKNIVDEEISNLRKKEITMEERTQDIEKRLEELDKRLADTFNKLIEVGEHGEETDERINAVAEEFLGKLNAEKQDMEDKVNVCETKVLDFERMYLDLEARVDTELKQRFEEVKSMIKFERFESEMRNILAKETLKKSEIVVLVEERVGKSKTAVEQQLKELLTLDVEMRLKEYKKSLMNELRISIVKLENDVKTNISAIEANIKSIWDTITLLTQHFNSSIKEELKAPAAKQISKLIHHKHQINISEFKIKSLCVGIFSALSFVYNV
eukprot:TRINITY_DN2410_c0_g1_i3.p1 TRINITY_DN2410_c0_g1~~TRINITY_DN2410_c0_g1_i3.p1  ORF type:complete len:489 (-),score=117.57 TRINITY_DN2410_c0_g1_i3:154-1620(-)